MGRQIDVCGRPSQLGKQPVDSDTFAHEWTDQEVNSVIPDGAEPVEVQRARESHDQLDTMSVTGCPVERSTGLAHQQASN